jgi:NAD(P) transhydrogenase subunit beta
VRTIFDQVNLGLMVLAIVLSAAFWFWGKKVPITDMPQMVAIFNGMGGGSAAAIGGVALLNAATYTGACTRRDAAAHAASTAPGSWRDRLADRCVSFSGSVIAWAKLDGRMDKRFTFRPAVRQPRVLPRHGRAGAWLVFDAACIDVIIGFFVLALLVGVLMTLPIGGADMPVVISLYNAFTGLAVAFEGYVLGNEALIIAGTVVGAAGMLLTQLMAKAMNRPISNVLFSNFGGGGSGEAGHHRRARSPSRRPMPPR